MIFVIFKDLIDNVNINSVRLQILEKYSEEELRVKNGSYDIVFDKMLTLAPNNHKLVLKLKDAYSTYYKRDVKHIVATYLDFRGVEHQIPMEFCPFEDWLGCIVEENLSMITQEEFVAHCLYKMTYIGFDEDTRIKNLNYIKQRMIEMSNGKQPLYDIKNMLKDADLNAT